MKIINIGNYSLNRVSFKNSGNNKTIKCEDIEQLRGDLESAKNGYQADNKYSADYYDTRILFDKVAEFERLRKRLEGINYILENSTGANYGEDRAIITKFLEQIEMLSKDKGYNRIYGYDKIKEYLFNEFVIKVMAKDKTSQKTDVPNAFLFFGPNGCGKTLFAQALAEQTLSDVKVVNYDYTQNDPEKCVMEEIKRYARQSRDTWDNNPQDKKRTIIILNEAEYFLCKESPVFKEFSEFLKDCADRYKCTVFMTTNYPFDIDKSILSDEVTPYKICIPSASREDARAILQRRLQVLKRPYVNLDKIVEELFKNKERIYSNSQIVSIIDNTGIIDDDYSCDNYIKAIREATPHVQIKSLEECARFTKEYNAISYE